MIKRLAEHRIEFLLVAILLLFQSFYADLNSPYKKPIMGDAQGYYAYLPAIFIYQDLDYHFVEQVNQKYYVEASSKSFLNEFKSEKVNKTFPGVSLLYAPFFLTAHAIALSTGLEADGYSWIYQFFFLVGFWFYLLMGLIFFRKVLQRLEFTSNQITWSLSLIVLGTNIFFYTVYDQSVTHIHNFFLINWLIQIILLLKEKITPRRLALASALLSLLVVIRPTNLLVVGLCLFFVPEKKFYLSAFQAALKPKNFILIALTSGLILLFPIVLWKLQTGYWFVYSYGDEGFHFSHPEWFNFLFSYTKGWFVYTPILLLIFMVGFTLLFRQNKTQSLIGILFLGISIYVFSSWWCWYYGAGMSQRVMIDFYILAGFLIALITRELQRSRLRLLFASVALLLTTFNVTQAYQISKGILPFGSPTKEQYWNNFLVLKKRAEVYPAEHWVFVKKGMVDLRQEGGQIIKGFSEKVEGDWHLKVNGNNEYSAVAQIPTNQFKAGNKLIFTFEATTAHPISETRLVIKIGSSKEHVFMLGDYLEESDWKWEKMQYLVEFDQALSAPIDLFLWNAGTLEEVWIRNISWELYFNEEYY